MGLKEFAVNSRPALSMISAQLFLAGQNLLSRVILDRGISILAFLTYRHIVAAMFVAPFAFFMERDMVKKRITWSVLFWIFLNSIFGITFGIGFFYYGLRDTTATYSTIFLSMIPIITFILSVITGLENLGLENTAGRNKIVGTLLCVVGALAFSLYPGKAFHMLPSRRSDLNYQISMRNTYQHWVRGTFFLMGSCFSDAIWYLIQVKLSKIYPSKYWATTLTCIMGSMQFAVIGLLFDRSKASWRLRWDLQLLTIVYSGVLVTGASFCLNLWAIKNQGPTYPTLFLPLCMVFVAISEALIFGDAVTIRSILGTLMIIIGLYSFIWGKRKESTERSQRSTNATVSSTDPLREPLISQAKMTDERYTHKM